MKIVTPPRRALAHFPRWPIHSSEHGYQQETSPTVYSHSRRDLSHWLALAGKRHLHRISLLTSISRHPWIIYDQFSITVIHGSHDPKLFNNAVLILMTASQ